MQLFKNEKESKVSCSHDFDLLPIQYVNRLEDLFDKKAKIGKVLLSQRNL